MDEKELRKKIKGVLDRHSLGMVQNKKWKELNVNELLSLVKEYALSCMPEEEELYESDDPIYLRAIEKGFNQAIKQTKKKIKEP